MTTISKVTDTQYAPLLHDLLFGAFGPFHPFYTEGAFASTVAAEDVIKERIESGQYSVYAAHWFGNLAGTVSAGAGPSHPSLVQVSYLCLKKKASQRNGKMDGKQVAKSKYATN